MPHATARGSKEGGGASVVDEGGAASKIKEISDVVLTPSERRSNYVATTVGSAVVGYVIAPYWPVVAGCVAVGLLWTHYADNYVTRRR